MQLWTQYFIGQCKYYLIYIYIYSRIPPLTCMRRCDGRASREASAAAGKVWELWISNNKLLGACLHNVPIVGYIYCGFSQLSSVSLLMKSEILSNRQRFSLSLSVSVSCTYCTLDITNMKWLRCLIFKPMHACFL